MSELDNVRLPLQSTSEEISRICRDLERIASRQTLAEHRTDYQLSGNPHKDDLVSIAKQMIFERSLRARHLSPLDFGEPVWDILLDLYVNNHIKRPVSVSSACIAASVPATTALRYLSTLSNQGVIIRVPDKSDARRFFLQISDQTESSLTSYFQVVYKKRYAFRGGGGVLNRHEH
jgi:DNA-binding MarR family transcriptional regulator